MYKQIIDTIKKYDKIIIHRHKNPDLDALGSQLGLREIIKDNFRDKEVYAVGDMNDFTFLGSMDIIDEDKYKDALVIVTDVAVSYLVSDDRYKLGSYIMIIDHHLNSSDFGDLEYIDSSFISCAQIIADMAEVNNFDVSKNAATALLGGIITDSGRFLYPSTSAKTLRNAAYLMEKGASMQYIYDNLYVESLNFKKLKGHFINNFKTTKNKVAYMKNDDAIKEQFGVSTFTISRGMVNQMSGIKGVPIWVNFTLDDDGYIQTEIRSKTISVVEIAKKYGGGGHKLACGCTLANWADTDKVLKDLDSLLD